MVLCPFIFLSTRSDSPTLKLQPTEVASTHWVSLRSLLSPSLRTVEQVDVSDRFTKQGGPFLRIACRSIIGWMQFCAIRLTPTESLHCSSVPGFIPGTEETQNSPSLFQRWKTWRFGNQIDSSDKSPPLLLWGLTLGIMADFLDMLPPHTAVQLWTYPTFTPPDLRLIVAILTHRLRRRNALKAKSGMQPNQTAADSQTAALPVEKEADSGRGHSDVGIGGLGVARHYKPSGNVPEGTSYAVAILLKGYYDRLRVAIYVFLAWRAAASSIAAFYAWKLLRRR